MPALSGKSIIGFSRAASSGRTFNAVDPSTGENLEPAFHFASSEEVNSAVRLAAEAFEIYGSATGRQKGILLNKIAANIEDISGDLVVRASQETALPPLR